MSCSHQMHPDNRQYRCTKDWQRCSEDGHLHTRTPPYCTSAGLCLDTQHTDKIFTFWDTFPSLTLIKAHCLWACIQDQNNHQLNCIFLALCYMLCISDKYTIITDCLQFLSSDPSSQSTWPSQYREKCTQPPLLQENSCCFEHSVYDVMLFAQFSSSDRSVQSTSPSHRHMLAIQWPVPHRNSSSSHPVIPVGTINIYTGSFIW